MSKKVWKPTAQECKLIRLCGAIENSDGFAVGGITLEPGVRYIIGQGCEHDSMNELVLREVMVDGEQTDLAHCLTWADFRKGVELDSNGAAQVDFYIRPKSSLISKGDSLLGNVIAHYENGELVRVTGVHANGADLLPFAKNTSLTV